MSTDVVSFGETMLRLSPPGNVRLENASTLHVYTAGTESNTLACLARLGLHVSWLSALPRNPLGQHVESELRGHGVHTDAVLWAAETARMGIFYAEEAPNPLGVQVYYDRAQSACALIDPALVDYSVVDGAKLLHLTGITPALSEGTREVFARFLQRAKEKGIPLSFDVNYRAKLWPPGEAEIGIEEACQQADVLLCTQSDAIELWGLSGDPESMLQRMAQRFAENKSAKTCVLTLGSQGAAQLQEGIYSAEPAFPTEGTMRFGSGDAFAAGYLYAYLGGALYTELQHEYGVTTLAFGNMLAALKRCIAGDIASISPTELRMLLQRRNGTRFR